MVESIELEAFDVFVDLMLTMDKLSQWKSSLLPKNNLISLQRKVRPEGTTLNANESLTIKDSRSFFVHFLLFAHVGSKPY